MHRKGTVILLLKIVCIYSWILDESKDGCATLYSKLFYKGPSLAVGNPHVFHDLKSIQITSDDGTLGHDHDDRNDNHWVDNVKSFQINDNCHLRICNETLLSGKCVNFHKSTLNFSKMWKDHITSVGCACKLPDCWKSKCSSVSLRVTECGRAFIEEGCSTCDKIFLTLRKGNNSYVGDDFGRRIKSVKINRGCNLTVHDKVNFKGEGITFGSGTYETWSTAFDSYICTCTNPKTNSTESPNTTSEITEGMGPTMLNVPLSAAEVLDLERNHTGHKGLLASLKSLHNKRSSRNAYILVVGMTGSGKSATINFLFDNSSVAVVGRSKSTTKSIHEYRISVPVKELGINNSELVIIDTPGLGDTDGLDNDARFLATLEDYLMNHDDLRGKIPNIVLIFGKFHDNRSSGKASTYVKTLRAIDLLKRNLFYNRFSNAIFVFTHYMSVKNSLRRDPWSTLQDFKKTILEFTLLPKPISVCVAENEPIDYELPMINGFYLLPNGDYYPQNLFRKIQEVTTNGWDPIGEAIIRNAFKHPENIKIRETEIPLQTMNSSRVDYFFNTLSGAEYDIAETEVSNLTKMAYNALSEDFRKTDVKNSLSLLQRSLNVRNIFNLKDVPKSTVNILKLLKSIRKTEVTMNVLTNSLGIKTPEMVTPILVGNSYHLLRDVVLETSPFQQDGKKPSDIGYLIPNIVSLNMVNKPRQIFYLYNNKMEYYQARLNNLGVSGNANSINYNKLYGKVQSGFNILPENETDDFRISALRQHELFEIVLHDNPPLKPEFLSEIAEIGDFNQSDHENVAAWNDFFSKYGTHVVQSAFGGGFIEIQLRNTIKGNETVDSDKIRKSMGDILTSLFSWVDDLDIGRNSASISRLASIRNIKYRLRFRGGDFYSHSAPDFSKFDTVETISRMKSWDDSLRYQPIMLQSYMQLIPLSHVMRKSHPRISDRISKAANAFYNATLKYVPPPPQIPPDAREFTRRLEEILAVHKTFQEQIALLTKNIEDERILNQKLLKQFTDERKHFERNITRAKDDALEDVSLTCFYELKNLKGRKLCGASADECVNYKLPPGVQSINTYNSCVEVFPISGCIGKSYRHTSNVTSNTDFPFPQNGTYFSGQICRTLPRAN